MNLNWKKVLLIIVFVGIVILVGFLLYYLFFRPALPPGVTPTNINGVSGVLPPTGTNVNIPINANVTVLPPGAEVEIPSAPPEVTPGTPTVSPTAGGGLTQAIALSRTRAYGSTLSADGAGIQYYDRNSGLFYQVDVNGKITPLSDKIFFEVETVTWAPDKEKAVLEYPDGANIVYDFKSQRQVTLPSHWKDFDFSPNSDEIVLKSMGDSPENSWLAISSADGSQASKIELLGDKDATVYSSWSPNNQTVAMYTEDKDLNQQNLFFVGLNQENFKLAIIEGRGFQPKWSPEGDKLLYSTYSSNTDYKPSLSIVSAQSENIGKNRKSLNLQTWAEKCTFTNNDTVYCAVPQFIREGAGIYPQDFDNAPSDIYKIDLKSGFKTKVATPEGNHNIESLAVSNDNRFLYFVSKDDGLLYKINLK